MKLLKHRKGQAFIWLGVMAFIFIMGLFYVILSQPVAKVAEITQGNFTGTDYEPTYNKLMTIWDYWLVLFIIGIILFALLSAMRKRDYE